MKNLNTAWIALIAIGIIFLFGSIFISVYESLSGADSTFNLEVVEFEKKTILTETFKEHINNSL